MTYLTCPFCGEEDFDAYGLKVHLQAGWCEAYNRVDLSRLPRSASFPLHPTCPTCGRVKDGRFKDGSPNCSDGFHYDPPWKWAPPLCGKCYKLHHLGEPCPPPPKAKLEIKFTLSGPTESEVGK